MQKILLLLLIGVSLKLNAQPSPPVVPASAESVMKEACALASKENKKVFIIFHASWCGWCHKMDNSMNDPVCRKYFDDNFVIRHLVVDESKEKKDLENPGADQMRNGYFGKGQGIPYWLIFDKDGKLVADSKLRKEGEGREGGQNTGCPASAPEVAYFINVLEKTTKLGKEELSVISQRFRKNE
jgi:thioredoxin-related protein